MTDENKTQTKEIIKFNEGIEIAPGTNKYIFVKDGNKQKILAFLLLYTKGGEVFKYFSN